MLIDHRNRVLQEIEHRCQLEVVSLCLLVDFVVLGVLRLLPITLLLSWGRQRVLPELVYVNVDARMLDEVVEQHLLEELGREMRHHIVAELQVHDLLLGRPCELEK